MCSTRCGLPFDEDISPAPLVTVVIVVIVEVVVGEVVDVREGPTPPLDSGD